MKAASIVGGLQKGSWGSSPSTSVRVITGIVGVGLLVTGSIAVFTSKNTTGTAALIAAGVLVMAIAIYGDRIESFEGLGVKLQMAAASKLEAARKAEAAGDQEKAERLRAEAQQLLDSARSVARQYESIRATQASSWERTAQLEALVRQSHALAAGYSPEAVRELFRTGDEGNRIVAIGMMAARPELADPATITDAVIGSRSAFEQYHALRAARALATRQPRPPGTASMVEAIQAALTSGIIDPHSDRERLAREVIGSLT